MILLQSTGLLRGCTSLAGFKGSIALVSGDPHHALELSHYSLVDLYSHLPSSLTYRVSTSARPSNCVETIFKWFPGTISASNS